MRTINGQDRRHSKLMISDTSGAGVDKGGGTVPGTFWVVSGALNKSIKFGSNIPAMTRRIAASRFLTIAYHITNIRSL